MGHEHDREIWRLAVPAFFAIVTGPLFLLADSAVVGHLGAAPLAGLGVAGTVIQTLTGICVFLAYGTTASVARRLGAGDVRGALTQGMDGLWLALVIGVVVSLPAVLAAKPLLRVLGAHGATVREGGIYLAIGAFGITPILVVMASTGIVRGLQDTRTPLIVTVGANLLNIGLNVLLVFGLGSWHGMGIAGSALGTVISQTLGAVALVVVVVRGSRRRGARVTPDLRGVITAARTGIPLMLRTVSLRAALVVTTAAVAMLHTGHAQTVDLASHQLVLTLWNLMAYVLEALEIAAQALVGREIGAGRTAEARGLAARLVFWGLVVSCTGGAVLLATSPLVGHLFTSDPEVRHHMIGALVVAALAQPIAGVAFVLDGVLISAGDGPYLARAMLVSVVVYVPVVLTVAGLLPATGLVGVWLCYTVVHMGIRLVTTALRAKGDAWLAASTG